MGGGRGELKPVITTTQNHSGLVFNSCLNSTIGSALMFAATVCSWKWSAAIELPTLAGGQASSWGLKANC
ncbi:hypothetical protein BgiMline_007297, partial [Biomphalaria glabrata]